ncbi:nucleoside 2-deoxyribosyltransferase [Rhodococcus wratislaviensis]|uniref:Nucleoside 2-deoxyribosyltransferase n=1 Tax=Rhodococcus wratislaviensis NBRC 100605 TaxID=1219028 RepID=X0Q4W4_RHOWR|nr:nucleoside 2-deoxyribosyltransferase [Rhodococcus wratislaviensis]GAF45561.1 hypothetical protein RW1_022_01410 [Rhodococcus wratislaviensis NBRC 100605]
MANMRRAFVSLPITENLGSDGTFRPEMKEFYSTSIEAIKSLGLEVESPVLNENWGSVKLPVTEFVQFDIDAITRSDLLAVITFTRLSNDIYLEIGYAAGLGKSILIIAPHSCRTTYMINGLAEAGNLNIVRFDSSDEVPRLLVSSIRTMSRPRSTGRRVANS